MESVRKDVPDGSMPDFYRSYAQVYDIYMTTTKHDSHKQSYKTYCDSLKMITEGREQFEKPLEIESLHNLLANVEKWSSDYSFVTYHIGRYYEENGDIDSAKHYYTHSAISDIRTSNKDQGALIKLAHLYYEEGKFSEAQKYASSCVTDAIDGNMRIRTLRLAEVFNIIDNSYKTKEKQSKWSIITSLTIVCLILLYAFWQNIRLRKAKKELGKAYDKQNELTIKLSEQNTILSSAYSLQEKYISNFFEIGAMHINKLESYQHYLRKMIVANKIDDLHRELKSNDMITNEFHDQRMMFDRIFLDIYPTFIEEFNALMKPAQRIVLKPGELLNTEIRIYALMRIGFDNCDKIADFLRCTVPTVYTYRAKTRSRARMPKDEFEKAVMDIGKIYTEE